MYPAQVEFDIKTPVADSALVEQIRANLARGIEEVPVGAHKRGVMTIVASGPSAKTAPFGRHPTMALNNALKLFTEQGRAPTYWAACDPQEIVADFIPDDPPEGTIYLVASKCHPRVFDKLKDRKVLVWHVDDSGLDQLEGRIAIPTAVSITLCALNLSRLLGYFSMDVWGWDACYVDGKDHASDQPHSNAGDITVHFPDGRTFATTNTWAAEAQDAVNQMQVADYRVTVNGDGMIKPMLDLFAHTRLVA